MRKPLSRLRQCARAPLSSAELGLRTHYAAAVAQRNAALRRVAARLSSREAIAPWTERVALVGASLVEARVASLDALAPGFRADVTLIAATDWRYLAYHFGGAVIAGVVVGGEVRELG